MEVLLPPSCGFRRARRRLIKHLCTDALIWTRFTPPKILSAGLRSVPVCFGIIRALMQRSFGGFGVLKRRIECASLTLEYCSPSFRGPHKIACGDFAGSPIRAFLPRCVTARARLRGGVNFAAHLSHGCSFSPSEYAFGGDPLESSVLYHGSIVTPFLRVSPSFTPPKILSAGLRSVPVCFGVTRALMQRSFGGFGVLKRGIRCTSRGKCCLPLLPFGYSSPAREEFSPPKMQDILFVLFDRV